MIGLYEITRRAKSTVANSAVAEPGKVSVDSPVSESPDVEKLGPISPSIPKIPRSGESPASTNPRSVRSLKPPPPLPALPNRWILEIQKVVFHLTASIPENVLCPTILFSGMHRKTGATTISYVVAHQMAVEYGNQMVLYIDCRHIDGSKADGSDKHTTVINVGDPISPNLFESESYSLSRISVRLGDGKSVAAIANWFREFINAARLKHRAIVIDAPPFFAAPETFSLAKASDGVVIVLRAGLSRYSAVNALIADLEQLGIYVLGTVLNYRQYPIPKMLLKFM